VPLLMDATAVAGHAPLPDGWDILVADPRSWGAPGGLGVLVVRAGTRWSPPGPADEGTERVAGSPSVPLALAAAVALQQAGVERVSQEAHRRGLLRAILDAVKGIPDTEVAGNAGSEAALPHVMTFSSLYVDGEAVVGELDRLGFAVGSGSACTASTLEPSHVLAAMGVLTHGNIRIGLPAGIASSDVSRFCGVLAGAIATVRSMLGAEEL
jgi:cysteine desulfurase